MSIIALEQTYISHCNREILTAMRTFDPKNEITVSARNICCFGRDAIVKEMHPETAWLCALLARVYAYRLFTWQSVYIGDSRRRNVAAWCAKCSPPASEQITFI